MFIARSSGRAVWTIPIPTGLNGFVFFSQAISLDAGAGNGAGAVVSNSGRAVVGN